MRGRKPVPTEIKKLKGNPGRRPLPAHEPHVAAGAVMPEWLSADAAAHWPTVAKQLGDAGILTQIDATALALYCETFARWRMANDQVVALGPLIKSPNGFPMPSPFLGIANRAWDQMLKMLTEFGMTPSSRTRVGAVKPTEDDAEFAEFLRH